MHQFLVFKINGIIPTKCFQIGNVVEVFRLVIFKFSDLRSTDHEQDDAVTGIGIPYQPAINFVDDYSCKISHKIIRYTDLPDKIAPTPKSSIRSTIP